MADLGRRPVATVFGGRLEVFYLEQTGMDVRRASYDGTTWTFADLDGDSTLGGHTIHDVGYNLATGVWGGSLHVLYYEADPAYDGELGWVREADFDGSSWTYTRAFRANTIVPGKTLALGVVADDDVYVAYNTTIQGDPRLRWRHSDGGAWSDSSVLAEVAVRRRLGACAVRGGRRVSDPGLVRPRVGRCDLLHLDGRYGVHAVRQPRRLADQFVGRRRRPRIYWGAGDLDGCCDSLLLRTSRP